MIKQTSYRQSLFILNVSKISIIAKEMKKKREMMINLETNFILTFFWA